MPAFLNGGIAPDIKEKQYVERTVAEIDFDGMKSIDGMMMSSKTEKGVRIADDINETNLRDPQ